MINLKMSILILIQRHALLTEIGKKFPVNIDLQINLIGDKTKCMVVASNENFASRFYYPKDVQIYTVL